MTNEALVEIMKNLKTQWGFLKDESKAKVDKRQACKRIIELSTEAKNLDPKFEFIDMNNTQYAEFVPATYKVASNVNWGDDWDGKFGKQEMERLAKFTALAVYITRQRLPKEPDDSQKFGMIVSATTDKLIAIANS